MDNQSLSYSLYNCTYHIVFIPKYQRKVMIVALRREDGEILGKICKMEGVTRCRFYAATSNNKVSLLDRF